MKELKTWYRNRLPARIAALEVARRGVTQRDPEGVASARRLAHQLRGSGATYGYPEVSAAARVAEEVPEEGLSESLETLIGTLHRAFEDGGDDRATILIIEDDADVAEFLKATLAGPGRELRVTSSGAETQAILEKDEISLILLDLLLPDMDGRNLLMKIRERLSTAAIPVVVLTVRSAEQARAECLGLGADEYLEKPIPAEALQSAVLGRLRVGSDIVREF